MLQGLRIIEYATYIAAPGAGGILSDWGAEVIKIEPPKGDPIRNFFNSVGTDITANPVFDLDNRGKKSICLDTSTAEGQDILKRLAADADVFLTNVRPGGLRRSGLDYESLKKTNPKLVYCSLTGYGLTGPDADKPGFDIASFWARAGVANLTLPKGSEPFPLRTGFGDHTTSMAAAAGICAALVEAGKTGHGRLVESSLLRTALYALGSDFAIQLFFGRIGSTKSRGKQSVPIMNFFKTRDDQWLCIVARQGDIDWEPLCRAIGIEHLVDDERYTSARGRRHNSEDLVAAIDDAFSKYTKEEMGRRLDAEQIAWSPVQTLAQVSEDPQVIASGAIVEIPAAGQDKPYQSPASPVRFQGADDGPKGPSPELGEHTSQILKAMGYSSAEITAFENSGIARTRPEQT